MNQEKCAITAGRMLNCVDAPHQRLFIDGLFEEKIPRFVAETMLIAGGRPCPPVVLGVGTGGTFDGCDAALAKEALLLPIDRMDPFEQELCDAVKALGIGPMGLGGETTALAVKVRTSACHTASLPVAVNVQCWASRRSTIEVE